MNTMTCKGYTARVEYDERDKRGSLYKTAFRSGFVFGRLQKGGITAELEMFRQLAKGYEGLKKSQLAKLIEDKHLLEICHDDKKEI